jgi:nucleotide-binding universal stress UspA family protein
MARIAAPRKPTYLLATDGSPESLKATDYAVEMAKRTGARLVVISVAEFAPEGAGAEPSAERRALASPGEVRARACVDDATARAKAARVPVNGQVVRAADPAVGIVRQAEDLGADLVFIGSRGLTGIQRVLLGSVAERVVELAHCPVMVVR